VAAFRAGNAPHIVQIFEVGTASMMAAKGVIVPVDQVMKTAGIKFDPSVYVPAVSGYYTAPNGQMLSFPFNSSTTVLHYNKDAFKAAGLDPETPPKTWPEVARAASRRGATSAPSRPAGRAGRSWRASLPGTTWSSPPSATGSRV
jgi:sn-glycerol 3-phosphate transport system substrate-binding protein